MLLHMQGQSGQQVKAQKAGKEHSKSAEKQVTAAKEQQLPPPSLLLLADTFLRLLLSHDLPLDVVLSATPTSRAAPGDTAPAAQLAFALLSSVPAEELQHGLFYPVSADIAPVHQGQSTQVSCSVERRSVEPRTCLAGPGEV
jgi:hypothetical protein